MSLFPVCHPLCLAQYRLIYLVARVQKIINADPERLTVTKNASFAIALATEMMIQHLATTTHNVVKAERKPRRNIQYRDVSGAVSKTDNLEFLVDVVPKTTQYGAWRKRKAVELEQEARGKAKEVNEGPLAGEDKGKGVETEMSKGTIANSMTQTTLPPISIHSEAAQSLLARAESSQATPTTINGTKLDPLARKELVPVVPETEAMDVDGRVGEEKVAESEGEEDPAAMQIEMEMRGPQRTNEGVKEESANVVPSTSAAPSVNTAPSVMISSGGFTAINGR